MLKNLQKLKYNVQINSELTLDENFQVILQIIGWLNVHTWIMLITDKWSMEMRLKHHFRSAVWTDFDGVPSSQNINH